MEEKAVFWSPTEKKLVFTGENATPKFWDEHWRKNDFQRKITESRNSRSFRSLLKKYLPDRTSIILEGGCGYADYVDAMTYWGYRAYGVDFAQDTVQKVKEMMPNLDVRYGDVRSLEFPDNYFDGYISFGVIEHFWEGYEAIIKEMARLIKPGGYLFLSFPCISRLDRLKIRLRGYRHYTSGSIPERFYQFGLDMKAVKNDVAQRGFSCVSVKHKGGLIGLERVFPSFRKVNAVLNAGKKRSRIVRVFNIGISSMLAPLSGHAVLLVFRKLNP